MAIGDNRISERIRKQVIVSFVDATMDIRGVNNDVVWCHKLQLNWCHLLFLLSFLCRIVLYIWIAGVCVSSTSCVRYYVVVKRNGTRKV